MATYVNVQENNRLKEKRKVEVKFFNVFKSAITLNKCKISSFCFV